MDTKRFETDLERLYHLAAANQRSMHRYYDAIDHEGEARGVIDGFLTDVGLPLTQENRLAAVTRLVDLRSESLVQAAKQAGFDETRVDSVWEMGYTLAARFHQARFETLIADIHKEELLSPFYRALIGGVHNVGLAMTRWFPQWNRLIVLDINRALPEMVGGETAVLPYLRANGLLDPMPDGGEGDRSYSALVRENETFTALAYADAFPEALREITDAIEALIAELNTLEDPHYQQQQPYLAYFNALKLAFETHDRSALIARWADVDRAWMAVTAPLQVGHPLEYYEDHFRKGVAPEWDLRIIDPGRQKANIRHRSVDAMFEAMAAPVKTRYPEAYRGSKKSLGQTQLYIGRPLLYYGAELAGLFSAQVVPNDETVSNELGKKIFAYPQNVLAGIRARPFMAIEREFFPQAFLDKERHLVFKDEEGWMEVYDITTIGHEFGHTLWMAPDTEGVMNREGNFKNIEEFKATTGGLMAFFNEPEQPQWEAVMIDSVKRAVKLIAWMETKEVEPYYCEGLIHLTGLFQSGVLRFDGKKLAVDLSKERYGAFKTWYQQTYTNLALEYYLPKRPASAFLTQFAVKEGGHFLPKDPAVREFVTYYWERYQAIGRQIDSPDEKAKWLAD